MGHYVDKAMGARYKKVGFAFSNGKFNAKNASDKLVVNSITAAPNRESSNYLFKNTGARNFILNIDNVRGSTNLYGWINGVAPIMNIGAVYYGNPDNYYNSIMLSQALDVIIYFDEVNYSILL
jgi:erythromycin esterase-like protein